MWHTGIMIIACVNQKGGVGKTTLAVHLAAWARVLYRRVALLDADMQRTASRWVQRMERNIIVACEHEADAIIETAVELATRNEIVVADGAASLAESTRALLLVADVAVIPCGASVPELEATAATVRMLHTAQTVRERGRPNGLVALTRLRHDRCRLVREVPAAAASLGLPVCEHVLRLREAVADAPGQGLVVWELGGRARDAAIQIQTLCKEILDYAQSTKKHAGVVDAGPKGLPEQLRSFAS